MKALAILAMLASFALPGQAQMSIQEAFQAGKQEGQGGKTTARTGVNAQAGRDNVPGYTGSPTQGQFYGNGNGQITPAGTNRIVECSSSTAGNSYEQQECDAINFLVRNAETRVQVPVSKTDPLVTGSDAIIRSPGVVPGSDGANSCRAVTQSNPGEFITETCTTARETNFGKCMKTLNIEIHWRYTCPVNTVNGPYPVGDATVIPRKNMCDVKTPVQKWTCELPATEGPDENNVCWEVQTSGDTDWRVSHPAKLTIDYIESIAEAEAFPEIVEVWDNQCADKEEQAREDRVPYPTCELHNSICTQGAETREFDGIPVYRSCWQREQEFACLSNTEHEGCGPRASGACTYGGERCIQYAIDGKCAITEENYRCEKTAPSTTVTQVCEPATFCEGPGCFSTERTPDADLGNAAAMMELTRQAGVYGVDGTNIEIFKGYAESCTIKVLGGTVLKSCCGSSGGGGSFSNRMMLGAGLTVAGEAAKEAALMGSFYTFDALYMNVDSGIVNKGLEAMHSWASELGNGTFDPTFSFYGFQFQFTFANGFQFVGFDPWSFAFAVVMMVIQEWLSCEQDEIVMSMKRGQNLCVHLGTRCSKRMSIIRTCLEKTESHCCFNSVLAKIVNRQGRAQLGLDMNSCGGFNADQIQRLDFSRMDLSEFIQLIAPKPSDPNAASRNQQSVDDLIRNYYQDEP